MPAPTIMIIRHAEKPTSDTTGVALDGKQDADSLIPQGWQRAGALVPFFVQMQTTQTPTPQFLFATDTSNKKNTEGNRPQETIEPLQKKLGLTPTLISKTDPESTGLQQLVNEAMACNGVVLISWPHGEIPTLTSLIPNTPPISSQWKWPSDRFDMVLVFAYDTSAKTYTLTQVPQLLLDGDSSQLLQISYQPGKAPIV